MHLKEVFEFENGDLVDLITNTINGNGFKLFQGRILHAPLPIFGHEAIFARERPRGRNLCAPLFYTPLSLQFLCVCILYVSWGVPRAENQASPERLVWKPAITSNLLSAPQFLPTQTQFLQNGCLFEFMNFFDGP